MYYYPFVKYLKSLWRFNLSKPWNSEAWTIITASLTSYHWHAPTTFFNKFAGWQYRLKDNAKEGVRALRYWACCAQHTPAERHGPASVLWASASALPKELHVGKNLVHMFILLTTKTLNRNDNRYQLIYYITYWCYKASITILYADAVKILNV